MVYLSVLVPLSRDISEIKEKNMEENQIVPDVISTIPLEVLKVTFTGGATVNQGNVLRPNQVKDIPDVRWSADEQSFYTVCLTDPDAPNRQEPIYGQWNHWLVVNVPGSNVEAGDTLTEYIGSGPGKGTGMHRYIFLIYKQNEKMQFDEKRLNTSNREERRRFKISQFAEKYKLGNPVAGNFYFAEWEE